MVSQELCCAWLESLTDFEMFAEESSAVTRSRKRKRQPEKWKQSKRKKLRNSGEAYTSCKGKSVEKKVSGDGCQPGGGCPFKCYDELSSEQRKYIYENFWQLEDYEKQSAYIAGCIKIKEVKRRYVRAEPGRQPKRMSSREYHLTLPNDDSEEEDEEAHAEGPLTDIRVCKRTFLSTLAISGKRVDNLASKLLKNPLSFADRHGKTKKCTKAWCGGHGESEAPHPTISRWRKPLRSV